MENPFDDIPDMTPRGTIVRALPHAFVNCDKPLELEMRIADVGWNPDYADARAKRLDEITKVVAAKDDATLDTIIDDLFARTVIVGWNNCNAKDRSTPLAYSPDLAASLLAELRRKGLKDELSEATLAARDVGNFRASAAAAAAALGK